MLIRKNQYVFFNCDHRALYCVEHLFIMKTHVSCMWGPDYSLVGVSVYIIVLFMAGILMFLYKNHLASYKLLLYRGLTFYIFSYPLLIISLGYGLSNYGVC